MSRLMQWSTKSWGK